MFNLSFKFLSSQKLKMDKYGVVNQNFQHQNSALLHAAQVDISRILPGILALRGLAKPLKIYQQPLCG